jgi:hypothetical protein
MNPAQVHDLVRDIQCLLGGRVSGLRLLRWNNGLVLHGRARSYYAKQLAQEVVMRATTLPLLANEIEVLWPTTVDQCES